MNPYMRRFGQLDDEIRVGTYFDPRTGNPEVVAEPASSRIAGANTSDSAQSLNAPYGASDVDYVTQQINAQQGIDNFMQRAGRNDAMNMPLPGVGAIPADSPFYRGPDGQPAPAFRSEATAQSVNPEYLQQFKENSGQNEVDRLYAPVQNSVQVNRMLNGVESD